MGNCLQPCSVGNVYTHAVQGLAYTHTRYGGLPTPMQYRETAYTHEVWEMPTPMYACANATGGH